MKSVMLYVFVVLLGISQLKAHFTTSENAQLFSKANTAPVPDWSFSTNDLEVSFNDNSSESPTSWLWDFGDGNTSTTQHVTHTYPFPGTYTACLIVSNESGSDSTCKSITVSCPGPTAVWNYTDNQLAVSFTDQSTESPTSWFWDFGDGNTSTLQNPNHTYPVSGTYTACLLTSNICGTDTTCQSITLSCPEPVTVWDFTSNDLTVSYSDNSINNPTSWLWDFGDGNTSTLQNPNHSFPFAGTYTTCLTTYNDCGSDSICKSVTVSCAKPDAAYSFTASNLAVSFTDNSTNNPTSWFWDFGDGNTSTQQSPNHNYPVPGTYTACLITNSNCGSDTICQSITLTCPKPVTIWDFNSNDLTVSYSDNSSNNPTSWLWDFGDGNISTLQNPNHSFPFAGTYTTCLTTYNDCGSDSTCKSVTVSCAKPEAAYSFTANNLAVSLNDNSTNNPTSWFWDFGDGNTSTQQSPNHNYPVPGTYTTCLITSSNCGSDTTCQLITLTCPKPVTVWDFNANNLTVSFNDNSTENPTSWLWDFGDGNISTFQNPNHSFPFPGTYTTCLTTYNECGSDSTCKSITVSPSLPETKLIDADCGITNVGLSQILTADIIPEANVMYEFRVTAAGGFERSIIKSNNSFTLLELNNATGNGQVGYNTTYTVEVRQSVPNINNPFGTPCQVTTKAFPFTKLRDEADPNYYIHVSLDKTLYADEVEGAESYIFEVYDAVTYNTHYITNSTNEMNLLMLPEGTAFHNQYYSVKVKAVVNGVEGTYGTLRWVWVQSIPTTQIAASQDVTVALNQAISADPIAGTITYDFYFSSYYYTGMVSSSDATVTMSELPGTPPVGQWYAVYVRTIQHGPYGVVYSNWGVYTWIYLESGPAPAPTNSIVEASEMGTDMISVYPNPFQESTSIQFELDKEQRVFLQVLDMTGKEVKVLTDAKLSSGSHTVDWDGTNQANQKLARGIYLVSLRHGNQLSISRVVIQ